MDVFTWLGLNNHPAEMAGIGVIPAWLARHIANGPNTTLRRLITAHDTGRILSVGRELTVHLCPLWIFRALPAPRHSIGSVGSLGTAFGDALAEATIEPAIARSIQPAGAS